MTNIDKTMNENDKGVIPPTTDTETTENKETNLEIDIELEETEDVESLKKQIQTLSAQKDHWKTKATKKPEVVEKKEVVVENKPKNQDIGLAQTDVFALIKADVAEEDIPEIVDYAKLKGISVSAALKTNVVKTILAEKQEERNTAKATNTSKAKGSSSKVSDEDLLANARKGIMPDNDADLARLIRARKGYKQ